MTNFKPQKRKRLEQLDDYEPPPTDWDEVEARWEVRMADLFDPSGLRRREGERNITGPRPMP